MNAQLPGGLSQSAAAIQQDLIDLLDDGKARTFDLLLGRRSQAGIQGRKCPLAHRKPVLLFYGRNQRIEGAPDAFVRLGLKFLPQARKTGRGSFLDAFRCSLGAVRSNGADSLHRSQRAINDLGIGLGNDLLLLLSTIGKDLSDRFGVGLDATEHCIRNRGDRRNHIPDHFSRLLDGLFTVRRNRSDGFNIPQNTIHQLAAGFRDGFLGLLAAVRQLFVDGLGGAGNLANHFRESIGIRVHYGCSLRRFLRGIRCSIARLGIGRNGDICHSLSAVGKIIVGICPGGGPVDLAAALGVFCNGSACCA